MPSIRRVQLPNLEPEEVSRILSLKKSAIVAFLDAEGYPRMVPCWFLWDGLAFHAASQPDKFHVRQLERDNRASFCVEYEKYVEGEYRGNRQVKGVGNVEILPDPDGAWLTRIREKYLGPSDPTTSAIMPQRVVLRLEPHSLTAHGGEVILT